MSRHRTSELEEATEIIMLSSLLQMRELRHRENHFRTNFCNVCATHVNVQNTGMARCWPGAGRPPQTELGGHSPHLDSPCTPSKATQALVDTGPRVLLSPKDQHWESWLASREVPAEAWCLESPGALRHPLLPYMLPTPNKLWEHLGDPAWPDVPCLSKELKF